MRTVDVHLARSPNLFHGFSCLNTATLGFNSVAFSLTLPSPVEGEGNITLDLRRGCHRLRTNTQGLTPFVATAILTFAETGVCFVTVSSANPGPRSP